MKWLKVGDQPRQFVNGHSAVDQNGRNGGSLWSGAGVCPHAATEMSKEDEAAYKNAMLRESRKDKGVGCLTQAYDAALASLPSDT